ncbi:hypothetical protein LPJGGPFB_05285 [Ensifer adhaerens]|uniref:CHAP domain-containing protein n=1 Tax=Ensifer adhaerens TaxID=106592 RepID=UPI003D06C745|nr:hypothetical protein [Ensifer adhaerens]
MKRRSFIGGIGLGIGAALSTSGVSFSRDDPYSQLTEPNWQQRPVYFPPEARIPTLSEIRADALAHTGPGAPLALEVDLAIELLFDIPTEGRPFDIAYRFLEWRRGEVGTSEVERTRRKYYSREWPRRGNPVIMQFFDATGYRHPAGDTTFWCAAFVSWCIARSVGGPTSVNNPWPYEKGAASRSYRAWGQDVIADLNDSPRRGDVAVFQNTAKPDQGHVGFVERVSADHIWLLGGNQGAQNEYNGGEVNIARYSRSVGGSLRFHSFRRHEVLG